MNKCHINKLKSLEPFGRVVINGQGFLNIFYVVKMGAAVKIISLQQGNNIRNVCFMHLLQENKLFTQSIVG